MKEEPRCAEHRDVHFAPSKHNFAPPRNPPPLPPENVCWMCQKLLTEEELEDYRKRKNYTEEQLKEMAGGLFEHWIVELNDYQRNNLVWLLELVAGGSKTSVTPFNFADNADWVGELLYKLKADTEPLGTTNDTRENIQKRIYEWLRSLSS